MADDANGVIYRIAYEGGDRRAPATAMAAPAGAAMREQAMRGTGVPLGGRPHGTARRHGDRSAAVGVRRWRADRQEAQRLRRRRLAAAAMGAGRGRTLLCGDRGGS